MFCGHDLPAVFDFGEQGDGASESLAWLLTCVACVPAHLYHLRHLPVAEQDAGGISSADVPKRVNAVPDGTYQYPYTTLAT